MTTTLMPKVDHQFVYSGNKSQQLQDVVKQLRREGKVVMVVKPGQAVPVLDSDLIIHDEDPKYWEWKDYVRCVESIQATER